MSAEDFLSAQEQKLGNGLSSASRDSEVMDCGCGEVQGGFLATLGRDGQHQKEQNFQIVLTPGLV